MKVQVSVAAAAALMHHSSDLIETPNDATIACTITNAFTVRPMAFASGQFKMNLLELWLRSE